MPGSVLEVGPGTGVVSGILRKDGNRVKTLDIDTSLKPDIVASVTDIPCADGEFGVALAAEVLEHIHYRDVAKALSELARVSTLGVVISLPFRGRGFHFSLKLPGLKHVGFDFALESRQSHLFDGQHYWELGTQEVPLARFLGDATRAGLTLKRKFWHYDDRAHMFLVFTK